MLFSANLLSWLHWSITHFYRKIRISHSSLCRQRFLGNVLKSVPLIQSFYFQKPNTCFFLQKNILWAISSNLYFNTGCPTKHDSMQDDLNVVLIFDIIFCALNISRDMKISFRFRQFCFYLTKLKSEPNSLYLR